MSLPLQGNNTIVKVDTLIKEVIRILRAKHIVLNWANTKYEGEIKAKGDTVRVKTFPRIYFSSGTTAGADITASTYAVTSETLTADQIDQVRIEIADLQNIISDINDMELLANEIAYSMNEIYERFVIGLAVAGAYSKLYESSPVTLTSANVWGYVEEMKVALEELNAGEDCALFVSPNVASLIRQNSMFDGFREGLDVRKTGMVGRLSGMEVYKSNYIPNNKMIALDRDSVHFAAQMTGMKVTDAEKGFRKNILSEIVFGGKVFTENAKRIATLKFA